MGRADKSRRRRDREKSGAALAGEATRAHVLAGSPRPLNSYDSPLGRPGPSPGETRGRRDSLEQQRVKELLVRHAKLKMPLVAWGPEFPWTWQTPQCLVGCLGGGALATTSARRRDQQGAIEAGAVLPQHREPFTH